MARFIDLEAEPKAADAMSWPAASGGDRVAQASTTDGRDKSREDDSSDHSGTRPHVQNSITEALGCYPIVIAVVSHIDLNTLDALARVCRGIHDGLVQYRSILLTSTLHCSSEATPVNRDALLRYRARSGNWHYMEDGRGVHGKSGYCARDMVQECRRCSEVVCRNCAIKPPAPVALRERHRRLCTTCARAPLAAFLGPHLDTCASLDSEAVQRAICTCNTRGVWLCQPCGRGIRNTDCEYQQIWHWRSHYGEVLGGLGTGIGDGDRGVICGRESRCLAAREIEQEMDCDAEDARWHGEPRSTPSASPPVSATSSPSAVPAAVADHPTSPVTAIPLAAFLFDGLQHDNERAPSPQLGPGYERHEIEGIGGRVKRKLVRMVRIGACVPEGFDETGFSSRVLGSEVRGDARSWCGWCWRVIPGRRDNVMFDADAQSAAGDASCTREGRSSTGDPRLSSGTGLLPRSSSGNHGGGRDLDGARQPGRR